MTDEPHLSVRLHPDGAFQCLPAVERFMLSMAEDRNSLPIDQSVFGRSLRTGYRITFSVWFKPGFMQELASMFSASDSQSLLGDEYEFLVRSPDPRTRFKAVPLGTPTLASSYLPLDDEAVREYLQQDRRRERVRQGLSLVGTPEEERALDREIRETLAQILAANYERLLTKIDYHVNTIPQLRWRDGIGDGEVTRTWS